ncbi:hypothetical protein BV898_02297 [Hypsibius exemplaris]|uniref:Spaetzle domain-containing protein n=1 Tax=Hypsibius exemplaris TaxID=2072580 RepID=A0A1W0X976_HYPEX|nr:hypothetical protein BV898_02297 [Hypsibius exemplaris]
MRLPVTPSLSSAVIFLLLTLLDYAAISLGDDVNSCVRSTQLKHITEQVDLDCLKSLPTVTDDERIRTARSVQGGGLGMPLEANPNAIPKSLLEIHADMRELLDTGSPLRMARRSDDMCTDKGCFDLPTSPCETTTDVVTPINATSATSGATVWIAQFPGLFIQTITYSKCKRSKCWYLNGGCRQIFSPYLLITHPPGPVSIFGQDYVLVESGCVCEPDVSANRSLNNNMELYLPEKAPKSAS